MNESFGLKMSGSELYEQSWISQQKARTYVAWCSIVPMSSVVMDKNGSQINLRIELLITCILSRHMVLLLKTVERNIKA